jgi:hypothetical protein
VPLQPIPTSWWGEGEGWRLADVLCCCSMQEGSPLLAWALLEWALPNQPTQHAAAAPACWLLAAVWPYGTAAADGLAAV